MPKRPTFPTLIDEALQLEASKLNKWDYLKPNQIKSGTITWTWRNSGRQNSISIIANTKNHRPFVELDYKYGGKPRNYKVYLETVPSNLGKGKVWYFLCPQTQKRCRKLYSVDGYFLHREAFQGAMYEKVDYRDIERLMIFGK